MKEIKNDFVTEIKGLLGDYIVDEKQLNRFFNMYEVKEQSSNNLVSLINDFYARQLKIEYDHAKERMQIDRTITYARKVLSKDRYLELLHKLAHLCIANGKLNFAFEITNKILKENLSDNQKADAYLLLSDAFSYQADWNNSLDALAKANQIFTAIQNRVGIIKCENMMGVIHGEKRNLPEAREHFQNCLNYLQDGEEFELTASIESNLGIIKNVQGEYDSAEKHFEKALRYFESVNNYRLAAETRQNIGMLYFNKNELDTAIHHFDKNIEAGLNHKLMSVLSIAYISKANALLGVNDLEAANAFADKALEVSHLIDDKLTIADVYKTKSIIERKKKNYQQAENYLQTSLRINNSKENNLNAAEIEKELGELYSETNDAAKKDQALNDSLKRYQEMEIPESVKKIEEMLSAQSL